MLDMLMLALNAFICQYGVIRRSISDSRMWVESVGEFEQNFQSVESFALAEIADDRYKPLAVRQRFFCCSFLCVYVNYPASTKLPILIVDLWFEICFFNQQSAIINQQLKGLVAQLVRAHA